LNCINSSFQVFSNNDISVVFTKPEGNYVGLFNVRRIGGVWQAPQSVFTPEGDILGAYLVYDGTREYVVFTSSIDGTKQLFISKYVGSTWGLPQIVTDQTCDIYQARAIQKGDNLHIVYVADDNVYGTLYHVSYDMVNDTFSVEEVVASFNQRNIYSPQLTVDSNGKIIVAYIVDKGLTTAELDNHIFYNYLTGVKSEEESAASKISMKYESDGIFFSFKDEGAYECRVIDKAGRIIKCTSNAYGGFYISGNDIKSAGVYFVSIKNGVENYTKKILWLR